MPAKQVNVKEFRAGLKEFLDGGEPIILKNHRRVVAVLLPTSLSFWWSPEEMKQELARKRSMLENDVRAELKHY